MATTQQDPYKLASLYLRTAGFPDTAENRRILAAWFWAESAHGPNGTIVVQGNNPLNITTAAAKGDTYRVSNGYNFSVWNTPQGGARAWANLVNTSDWRGYGKIGEGFKKQDTSTNILRAIFNSAWAGGNYASGGIKGASLLGAYTSIGRFPEPPNVNLLPTVSLYEVSGSGVVNTNATSPENAGPFGDIANAVSDFGKTITSIAVIGFGVAMLGVGLFIIYQSTETGKATTNAAAKAIPIVLHGMP